MDILSIFRQNTPKETPRQKITSGRVLAGKRSRATVDTKDTMLFGNALYISSPTDADEAWRTQLLDSKTLDRISPAKLIELMVDVSPEISKAFWDFLRFCNPGWEVEAKTGDEQNAAGQQAIEAMIDKLDELYGDTNVVINRLFTGAFIRGAFMAELVLDENGREFADLATPDPYTARFQRVNDPIRGTIWHLGQWQKGEWVDLSGYETIRYIPVDPLPGVPYGRSLVNPAIFPSLFIVGLLHDLRRVVAQQGYPRIDLEVVLEKLVEAMPADAQNDPEIMQNWVNSIIDEISTVYAALEPDDAYVHTDVIKVNRPIGTIDSSSLGAVDGLLRALERMVTRGLKSMPLLMGSNEAVSETHANRQWEIHVAGIKSLQHYCEKLLQRLFQLALQAQGIQADVEFRFSELRASEMLRDAQTEAIQISNAKAKYDNGWISQDEASEEVTGSAADDQEPRRQQSPPVEIVQDNGDGEAVSSDETRVISVSANGKQKEIT
jgi:hypothetical protein